MRALRLLLLVAAAGAAAAQPQGGSSTPQIQLVGRFVPGPNPDGTVTLPQLMTWSASSLTVSFTGSPSVAVALDSRRKELPPTHSLLQRLFPPWAPRSTWIFELDGQTSVEITEDKAPLLTWRREGLETDKVHVLRITKQTEAMMGTALVRSIELGEGGAFLPPPPSPGQQTGRRMLILGDSFSAGSGNTGTGGCAAAGVVIQDAMQAFGPLAAAHYGADLQLLAWSAAGLNVPTPATPAGLVFSPAERDVASPLMRQLFTRADALDPASAYNLSSFSPQVVVLAAGTNDFVGAQLDATHHVVSPFGIQPQQQWLAQTEDLARQIRTAYPSAAIVLMVFPLEQNMVAVRDMQSQLIYQQYMTLAFSRLQMAGIGNVHLLQVNGDAFQNVNWCYGHPSTAQHRLIAAQLIDFLDAVVPSFAAGPAASVPRSSGTNATDAATSSSPTDAASSAGNSSSAAPPPVAA